MTTLTLELPDGVFAATRNDPDHFKRDMRVAAAVTWYQEGRISQEMAASIAGLDRTDFLLVLARSGHDSFVVDFDDLDKELARGKTLVAGGVVMHTFADHAHRRVLHAKSLRDLT